MTLEEPRIWAHLSSTGHRTSAENSPRAVHVEVSFGSPHPFDVSSALGLPRRIVSCLVSLTYCCHLVLSCVTRRFESAPPRGATRRPSPRSSATWSGSWAGGEKTSNTNTCTSSSRTPSERRYFCVDETVCRVPCQACALLVTRH